MILRPPVIAWRFSLLRPHSVSSDAGNWAKQNPQFSAPAETRRRSLGCLSRRMVWFSGSVPLIWLRQIYSFQRRLVTGRSQILSFQRPLKTGSFSLELTPLGPLTRRPCPPALQPRLLLCRAVVRRTQAGRLPFLPHSLSPYLVPPPPPLPHSLTSTLVHLPPPLADGTLDLRLSTCHLRRPSPPFLPHSLSPSRLSLRSARHSSPKWCTSLACRSRSGRFTDYCMPHRSR